MLLKFIFLGVLSFSEIDRKPTVQWCFTGHSSENGIYSKSVMHLFRFRLADAYSR